MNDQADGHFYVWDAANPQDEQAWVACWASWPHHEVYAHPRYVQLYAESPAQRAMCAAWKGPDIRIVYPFILRDLTSESFWIHNLIPAFDIATPYGYGGPWIWGSGDRIAAASAFWMSFNAWAEAHRIVAEFIRFALFPDTLLPYPGQREERLQNVVRDLTPDTDTLWMDFRQKVRKNVNHAQRSGIQVELDPYGVRLNDFMRVYESTMKRREAGSDYFFSQHYLERIHNDLPGQFMYFHALYEGQVVSTELVLVSADHVYSFLGGTDQSAFHLRPNDLIKHEIILWAKQQEKRRFILGGGCEPADGIFTYKLAFAPSGTVPFFIGRRVLDQPLYDQLVARRVALAVSQGEIWSSHSGYFPAYRA
jgi:hypothetical protein